jgi:hypothetical protein
MEDDTFDVLEAAAFVRGLSLPEVIRPQIEALVNSLVDDHAIKTALRARQEHRATTEGKLSSIARHQDVEA